MDSLLSPLGGLLIATLISAWIIPIMIRIAPAIGMMDKPDPRKVHRKPIPRVGGVGIALGGLAAILLLAPHTPFSLAFLGGSLLLAVFGSWDDMREIGHYPKFIGQVVAAALVVWYGGVWIEHFPFFDEPLPAWFGKPFTVFALVGVINAINHADGLDGLAGGESLLSLGAMACLSYVTGNQDFLIFIAAVGGGLLGFVRYNTYPARVFMGDLGSQFLGFSVGVFAIALTQEVNVTLSKSLALLLVGLPIVDILAVLYQRVRGGMNWFKATRNHIHHRLLDLGFDHYQAVLIIYSIQAALAFLAVFVCYESEALILAIYLGTAAALFALLTVAERRGWRLRRDRPSLPARFAATLNDRSALVRGPLLFVQVAVPLFLIYAATEIGSYQAIASVQLYAVILIIALAALLALGVKRSPVIFRFALYTSIGMISYCIYSAPPTLDTMGALANGAFFLLLAGAVSLAAMIGRSDDFAITNMDFLIVVGLVTAAFFSQEIIGAGTFWKVAIGTTLVFYGCELIILRGNQIWNYILSTSAASALTIIVGRTLL